VLAGLVAVVVAVVFGNGWGRFFTDAQPDLYLAPARVLRSSLSAWLPSPYVGGPNYQAGLAPAAAVSTVLSWFGLAPWVIMRVIRVALLVLAAAGARALYRDLLDPRSAVGRTAAAVLFVANPYVVVTAASLAVMQPLAALPWLLLLLSRALRGEHMLRNVALCALVFFAMGGENAGVVPLLLLAASLPALLVDALALRREPLRAVAGRLLACLASMLAVSLYWIVPSLSAVGAGSAVAAGTETPQIIYSTSSFAEILRGLGGWPLYGRDASGPFQPEFVLYITAPLVVLGSFTLCLLGLLGAVRGTRRRLVPLVLVVSGLVVSAAAFPYEAPASYGRVWLWALTHLPGLIALRTGVKAGGAVILGLALLGGLAVRALLTRAVEHGSGMPRGARAGRAAVAAALGVGVLVAVLPAVDGRLFERSFVVPDYWVQAADRLDAGDPSMRVVVVPGQRLFAYRWRRPSADDPLAGLTDRRLVLRTTTPTSTAPTVDFLAALDQPLQAGTQLPGAVSAMARYLAADEIVLRSDVVWETTDGGRPSTFYRQLQADPGLAPDGAYGRPGQNVAAAPPVPPGRDVAVEDGLPPVQMYRVASPEPIVRASPSADTLLVVGDNSAVPALVDLGYLDGRRPYLLVGALTAPQIDQAFGSASGVVLTDGNQRRTANLSRLANGYGPVLPATADPGGTDALFGATDQSVLDVAGASSITASSSGSIFGPVPYGGPRLAFDGDPSTGWVAGDFGTALGQSLTVTYPGPRTVSSVRVVAMPSGPVRLQSVSVTVGGVSHPLRLGEDGVGVLSLPPTATRAVTVRLTGTTGDGQNAVGIAELQVGGAPVTPYIRLPRTLDRVAATSAGAARLAALPLEVLLQRDAGLDREGRLLRIVDLPDARSFAPEIVAALDRSAADPVVDALAGTGGAAVVSSGRLLGDPALRGSQAFDGDPTTMWVGTGPSPWVRATFTPRTVDSVTLVPATGSVDGTTLKPASSVRLTFDDGTSLVRRLGQDRTTFTFPARRTGSLQVTLTAAPGQLSAGLASVALGDGPPLVSTGAVAPAQRCVDLVSVDGQTVPMRAVGATAGVLAGTATRFVGCGQPLDVASGAHAVQSATGWRVDRVVLSAPGKPADVAAAAGGGPAVDLLGSSPTSYHVSVGPSAEQSLLVVGEPYDTRWHASLDGRSLGAPVLADGYALGWWVPAGAGGTVTVSYDPQRRLTAGVLVSGLALAAALVVAWRRPRRSAVPAGRAAVRTDRSGEVARSLPARLAIAVGTAVGVYVLGGPAVLAVAGICGLAVAPWLVGWTRRAAIAGVALVAAAPFAYLLGNLGRLGQVTPDLIRANLLPHILAGGGIALLTVAVAVEVLGSRPAAETDAPPDVEPDRRSDQGEPA
jgi:arabinofuranan 3-O-arabinosyltransferase